MSNNSKIQVEKGVWVDPPKYSIGSHLIGYRYEGKTEHFITRIEWDFYLSCWVYSFAVEDIYGSLTESQVIKYLEW